MTLSTHVLQSVSAVLAAEEEPNPLLPHTSELIVGVIAFALLYFFLRAKVFPVFEKTFAERRDAIEGGMERAEEAEEEAKETLAQYREQLAEARHEAARLREEAREQGAAIIAEMREQAQAEARRLTDAGAPADRGRQGAGDRPAAAAGRARWPPTWPAASSASRSRTRPASAGSSTASSSRARGARRRRRAPR